MVRDTKITKIRKITKTGFQVSINDFVIFVPFVIFVIVW